MATNNLNLYQKLNKVRQEVRKQRLTQSGKNNHAEFLYYELVDIIPVAEPLLVKNNLIFIVTFSEGNAYGKLIDTDDPLQTIMFATPMAQIAEPAKFRMNEVQANGAAVTYHRRYLWQLLLDITTPEEIDAGVVTEDQKVVKEQKTKANPKTPVKKQTRTTAKETLTNPDKPATKTQLNAIETVCKKLRELDPDQEKFIKEVAIRTNRFTEATRGQAEKLITSINAMIAEYSEEEK